MMEYCITLKFATGSIQEFHTTGIIEALSKASMIINVCKDVVLLECNIKVIQ